MIIYILSTCLLSTAYPPGAYFSVYTPGGYLQLIHLLIIYILSIWWLFTDYPSGGYLELIHLVVIYSLIMRSALCARYWELSENIYRLVYKPYIKKDIQ